MKGGVYFGCLFLLVACRRDSPPAPDASAPAVPPGFTAGPSIPIAVEKEKAVVEEIGEGSWVVFGPKAEIAVMGDGKTTTLWPQKSKLLVENINGALFNQEGDKILVWATDTETQLGRLPGRTLHVITVSDLKTVATFKNLEAPRWTTRGTIAFRRADQIWELTPTNGAVPKLVGPPAVPKELGTYRSLESWIAPDVSHWIVVNSNSVRRIELATGNETTITTSKLGLYRFSPDHSQACGIEKIPRLNIPVYTCGKEDVSFNPEQAPKELGLLSPTQLWLRFGAGGDFRVYDFGTKTLSPLAMSASATHLTPLPGGRYFVVHEHIDNFDRPRGLLDWKTKKLTPIEVDDFKQHALRLEGHSDDAAIGLVYRENPQVLDEGPGKLFRIRTPESR